MGVQWLGVSGFGEGLELSPHLMLLLGVVGLHCGAHHRPDPDPGGLVRLRPRE